ncbi:MAG: 4-(cytidine 5'-diphospho)-2-C-methyl-D-erythritol kinase, partial [Oscillospiraceae bacterium]|nr:4-(cytidine 5'-diphospho)-2-C-methyl-D-erythritol kinase [Oscillospiraceae bacterium]
GHPMTTLYEGAYAKLNLTLDVLGKREDGYHDLQSVMQTISIRDDVEIDIGTGKPWKLLCSVEGIPTDETNLAWKAAKVYCDAMHKDPDGLEIRILKRIPSGAGMGGGSADAAAVLRALNRHYGEPLSIFALAELGAQVGSDVPFCVLCGTAMVEGRGEKLRKLPDMPDCIFVVCKPEFSVSTPELYKKIDEVAIAKRPDNKAMESALYAGDLLKVAHNLCNVFDPVVTEEHLELNYIKSLFHQYGAVGYQMTGSGSAVFAIVSEFEVAAVICNMLKENYPQVYIAKAV